MAKFELPALPYAEDALAPTMSKETLEYHHGKHHKAYVDKLNELIAGTKFENMSLEEIIKNSEGPTFNNAAQVWNHTFFFGQFSPKAQTAPSGELAKAIDDAFGSLDKLKDELKARGAGHFASGWVWLVEKGGKLEIAETHDGDTLADQDGNPLLTVDVWEHAYYLDHQNARPAYLDAVIDTKLNWSFASENLARGTTWKYPG